MIRRYTDATGLLWHEVFVEGDAVRVSMVDVDASGANPRMVSHGGTPTLWWQRQEPVEVGFLEQRRTEVDWVDGLDVSPIADRLRAMVNKYVRQTDTQARRASIGAEAAIIAEQFGQQGRLRDLWPR
jgi:hypothetical protein